MAQFQTTYRYVHVLYIIYIYISCIHILADNDLNFCALSKTIHNLKRCGVRNFLGQDPVGAAYGHLTAENI